MSAASAPLAATARRNWFRRWTWDSGKPTTPFNRNPSSLGTRLTPLPLPALSFETAGLAPGLS